MAIKNASVGYNNSPVLRNVSFTLNSGDVLCLLGANGAGKTTIFRTLMGFLKPIEGAVLLDGTDTRKIRAKDFARIVAYVPQSHELPFPYSVLDVVVMGCTVCMNRRHAPGEQEYTIARNVLKFLEIDYLSEKLFSQISGGERQMVLIARALAQNPKLLLMDEPTANLDYGNQVLIIQIIKKLKRVGLGILLTTHNPDHAFLCGDKAVLLMSNSTIVNGNVDEVITESSLSDSYGVAVKIMTNKIGDGMTVKNCVPLIN